METAVKPYAFSRKVFCEGMRDGDIVEQGTHDQLIEAGGFYADLYNSQFEDVVD